MDRFDPSDAPVLVAAARADRGMSQARLAAASGMSQPHIAAIELGKRRVSTDVLERILRAADYRPSLPLERHAGEIRELANEHGIAELRVFGSTARGDDGFGSDIDLIGAVEPGRSYFDIGAFVAGVEAITGFPVDFVVDGPDRMLTIADGESVPL